MSFRNKVSCILSVILMVIVAFAFSVQPAYASGGPPSISHVYSFLLADSGDTANSAPVITNIDKTISCNEDGSGSIYLIAADANEDILTWSIDNQGSHGSASFEEKTTAAGVSATVSYEPDQNYFGEDSFQVTVDDGNGGQDTVTVNVTVISVNDDPVINGGAASVSMEGEEDQASISLDLSAADIDSGTLTWTIKTQGNKGTASFGGNSTDSGGTVTVTYAPDADACGTDSFVVEISDGNGGTDTIVINVMIDPANDTPVISGGAISADLRGNEDSAMMLNLTAEDMDQDALTWSIGSQGSMGMAAVSGTGTTRTITYTPNANANGTDSFTVEVSDGNGGTDTIVINVTIDSVNDAPIINGGAATTSINCNEDQRITNLNLTAVDAENDNLTWSIHSQGTKGTASIDGNGTITYIPNPDVNGTDSFVVEVSDGELTSSITVNVNIAAVNDAPVFTLGGDKSVAEDDGPQTFAGFITGASPGGGADEASQTLSYTLTNNNSGLFSVQPAISAAGVLTFTSGADKYGTAVVTVTAKDSGGASSVTVYFNIEISSVNDAPVITQGDTASLNITEDHTGSFSLAASDADLDSLTWRIATQGSIGTAAVDSSGNVSYIPNENANGMDGFVVEVSDGQLTDILTVNVTVSSVNDAPTMSAIGNFSMSEDTEKTVNFTINDVDNTSDSLTLAYETSNTALLPKANIVLGGSGSARTITLKPVADRSDDSAIITLTIKDSSGASTTQSFTVTVDPENDAPTIGTIANRTTEEDKSTGTIGIPIGDIDTDLATLNLTVTSDNPDLVTGSGIVKGGSGANRTLAITPSENQWGTANITVTVDDGSLSASTSFKLTVTPVDDAPTIGTLNNATTNEDVSTGAISFTIGDIDDDADSLTVSASADNTSMIPRDNIELGGSGENRTICLTPATNKYGTAVITLSVKDTSGLIARKSFTLTVNAMNDAPTLADLSGQTTNEDTPKDVTVTVSDIEDTAANITSSAISSNTALVPNGNLIFTSTAAKRTLRITPAANVSGTTEITVTITDSGGLTDSKTFLLTVNAVNDAPTFTAGGNQTIAEDFGLETVGGWATAISSGPSDESGQTVTFTVTNDNNSLFETQPAVDGSGRLTFKTALNTNGSAVVSVRANDNGGTANGGVNISAICTFTITVTPVNDAPVAQSMSITLDTDEDKSFKGVLLASDVEHDPLTFTIVDNGSKGTVVITDPSTGAFAYTPNENSYGSDAFTFKVSDGKLESNVTTVDITIVGVNDAPVANDTGITTDEDTPYDGSVKTLATDVDSSTIYFEKYSDPAHGAVSMNSDGTFTYTPGSDYFGTDYFTFRAFDGYLYSNTATVTATVNPVNDAPVAADAAITMYRGQALHGVLKASDLEKDAVSFMICDTVTSGALTLDNSATGVFTYVPVEGQLGAVSFTYQAKDVKGALSEEKKITINIADVNVAPAMSVITNLNFAMSEDDTLTNSVSATDPNLGDSVTYTIVSGVRHGEVSMNGADGTFTYKPDNDYNGTDLFTVKATDSKLYSSTIIAKITIDGVNDSSTAYSQILETTVNTPVSGTLIATDPDRDTLTYTEETSTDGTVALNGTTGVFTFTPRENFTGTATFTFHAADGKAQSNTATVYVHVYGNGGGTHYGIGNIGNRSIDEDSTDTVDITLAGFTGSAITVSSGNQNLVKNDSITTALVSQTETEAKWRISMSPILHKTGATVINVSASGKDFEGNNINDGTTYILYVNKVNHAPAAYDKSLNMDQYTTLNEYVTGSDDNADSLTFQVVSGPAHAASFNFDSSGVFCYVPADNYYGDDGFTFRAYDGSLYSEAKAVSISIRKINKAPIASSGSISTDEDTTHAGKLTGYDTYGDAVTYELVNGANKGTVTLTDASAGTFTYVPEANVNGSDAFSFRVKGTTGLYSETAVIDITIVPVNDQPTGVQKTFTTYEDETLKGFLQGDDIEKDSLTYHLVSGTTRGAVELNESTGAFTYIPDENINGEDSFEFRVSDGTGTTTEYSEPVKITIEITPVNDTPTASDSAITVTEDQSYLTGDLSTFVDDVDEGDTQAYSIVQNGEKGTVTLTNASNGAFTYIPKANENGTDHFSFRTADAAGAKSNVALITVNITPINDNPTITGAAVWSIDEDSNSMENLYNFKVGDIEDTAATLTVSAISGNTNLVSSGGITLGGSAADRWMRVVPIRHITGSTTLTITVADSGKDNTVSGERLTASLDIALTVNPVNDTPTINGLETNGQIIKTVTIDEDTSTAAIPFTIDDEESGSALSLSASSSNTSLVNPLSGVVFDGSGNSRTVTVTPLPDQNGTVRITVSVSDGNSARTAYVDVIVNPVNDAPVVNSPSPQTISEDTGTEILYYTVSDKDSAVEDITITAVSSDESKVASGTVVLGGNGAERTIQVTPVANATGDVNIRIIANDNNSSGINTTGQGIFVLHITPVNDAPTVGAISNVSIYEDTETEQLLFQVNDIDSPISGVTVSAISGNTALVPDGSITFGKGGSDGERWIKLKPAADKNGSALITVLASDGLKSSGTTFTLTVIPVNDAPTISAIANQTIMEDKSTGEITFTVGDIDDDVKNLSIIKYSENESAIPAGNITIVGNGAERTVKLTPLAQQNGDITIHLTVKDPQGATSEAIFVVSITPVNDIPSFKKGSDQTVLEDAGPQTVTGWATEINRGQANEAEQKLTFEITANTNPGLFSVGPSVSESGTLTYTPGANANGTATVKIRLKDDGGTGNGGSDTTSEQTFVINVTAVNDAPSFNAAPEVTVNEDSAAQAISWASSLSKGADNESSQNLAFSVISNDNAALFSTAPTVNNTTGVLSFKAAANAYGTANLKIVLKDNGGSLYGGADSSTPHDLTITVLPVNDPPSFTPGGNQNIIEDAGAQTVDHWATNLSKGPSNESGQALEFVITKVEETSSFSEMFTVAPSISSSGALTYTPAANANGKAVITYYLKDDGGTDRGGADKTTSAAFTITITATNDTPSFDLKGDQVVYEDAGFQQINGFSTGMTAGNGADEAAQTLTFTTINDNHDLFQVQPSVNQSGILTYETNADMFGLAAVTVQLSDNGGGVNYLAKTFTIIVLPVNDAPSFEKGSDQSISEDAGAQTVSNWAANISSGPANESGQKLEFAITGIEETGAGELFDIAPSINSSGALTYTPAADANGTALVKFILKDDGGTSYGGINCTAETSFTIRIAAVNDAPTLQLMGDQNLLEDAKAQEVKGFANISAGGGAFESSQEVTIRTTNDNNSLFAEQPEIGKDGTLTYTLAPDAYGTAAVTITITDDSDGTNLYTTSFAIHAASVNDAPSFSNGGSLKVGENSGVRTVENWASAISSGPANESSQILSFYTANDNNSLFQVQPSITTGGALSFTPAANVSGTAAVTVTLKDDGGVDNGGVDTSKIVTFNIKVVSVNELSVIGNVRNSGDKSAISGAKVTLTDLSGRKIKSTVTDGSGYYEFTEITQNKYRIEVTQIGYSDNSRITDVAFENNSEGVIREDFLMADFTLELTANPTAILGNGTDKSLLTAIVKDKLGKPIPGVVLNFDAADGTFEGGMDYSTDADGKASVYYVSADHTGVMEEINIPVSVTVNDTDKDLYGTDRIYVTFAPGVVEGVVTDGTNSNLPVEGAAVKVYKDFNTDNIIDFSFEQVTGPDGRYRIVIPKGGVDYDILITKPVTIGGAKTSITVKQNANPGAVSGTGDSYHSDTAASGIVVMKKNGTEALVSDLTSNEGMKIKLVDSLGHTTDISNRLDAGLGTFTTDQLSPGTYTIQVVYDLGDGKELVAGSTEAVISSDGEMNINEILIDPYGTITDSSDPTKIISGAKVELYYADTNELVPLPELSGFKPSDNANPQYSDLDGQYAFMVFPNKDYYIKAGKTGYDDFKSDTIHVGTTLVHYDFSMTPSAIHGGGGAGIPTGNNGDKDLGISISSEKMKVEENSNVTFTITYGNKTQAEVTGITITAEIPDGMTIADRAGGTVSGNTIRWTVDSLAGNARKTLAFTLKAGSLNEPGEIKEISAKISSKEPLSVPEDDESVIKIMLYSNRFDGMHERYMKGYPDGNFNPGRNITRAETAAIFARLLKLDLTVAGNPYTDVDQSHWAAGYIQASARAGLLTGYEGGLFAPDQYITRGELATVIARYFKIARAASIAPLENHFSDTSSNWADGNIEEVYRYEIVTGYEDGTFRPGNNILRSETVTMINRMLYRGPVSNWQQQFLDTYQGDWYYGQVGEASKSHKYKINDDGTETATEWIDDVLE